MRIIRTVRYSRDLRKLKVSAADIELLERTIAAHPDSGAMIQGLKGVRKARFRIGNRGKSGGGRAIYYVVMTNSAILMITAYAKADKEDLSPDDRKAILRSLEEFRI
jgi:hypothetical protein